MLRSRLCWCQVAIRCIIGYLLVLVERSEIFYVDRHYRQFCIFLIFWVCPLPFTDLSYDGVQLMLVYDLDPPLQDAIQVRLWFGIAHSTSHCQTAHTDSIAQTLTKDVEELYANPPWLSIYEKRFKNKAKSETLPAHAPRIVQHVGALSV